MDLGELSNDGAARRQRLIRRWSWIPPLVGAAFLLVAFDAGSTSAALVLLSVVAVSSSQHRSPALASAVAATMILSFWFIDPRGEFALGKRQEFIAGPAFLVVALVVSTLVERQQRALALSARESTRAAIAESEARAAAQRSVFLAAAGHDLRTPLTSIRVAAQAIAADRVGAADRAGAASARSAGTASVSGASARSAVMAADDVGLAEVIIDETRRMERVIEKMLLFGRASAAGIVLDRAAVDLIGLVQSAAVRVAGDRCVVERVGTGVPSPAAAPPGPGAPSVGPVSWDLPREVVRAMPPVDAVLFEQMLVNLLENAVRHAGSEGTVRVGAEVVAPAWELHVDDDGPGVSPDRRDSVFDAFAAGPVRRDGGGTGVGLAIVRSLAAAHGGTATCRDSPLGGARFVIRIPMEAS